jgi:hypothetical protein
MGTLNHVQYYTKSKTDKLNSALFAKSKIVIYNPPPHLTPLSGQNGWKVMQVSPICFWALQVTS